MITTAEASALVAKSMVSFGTETVEVSASAGRVLRQTVSAERDQPPFDRVMMDGIAINHAAFERGVRAFPIQDTQHAGDSVCTLSDAANCIEVMTGSVLPEGSDCVIPVERIRVEASTATLEDDYSPALKQFIHPRASDHAKGKELLQPGWVIQPADVAILASCGLADVTVSKQPVVRVISTGNELVAAGDPIEPQQIRSSNAPAIISMLARHGMDEARHLHLADDPKLLKKKIAEQLAAADILILSGGVSMGKADYVPEVLKSLGVDVVFHKVSQRPGKPMWFGVGREKQVVFALPGNPVSAITCARQYVIPAVLKASGAVSVSKELYVKLTEDVQFNPPLTCFLPVAVRCDESGQLYAQPVPTNTSGDFAALHGTDGYVELPSAIDEFVAGTAVRFYSWLMR